MTLIYVLPRDHTPLPILNISRSYIEPAFYQGWSLFAPDVPKEQSEFYYRCARDGEWGKWNNTIYVEGVSDHRKLWSMSEKLTHHLLPEIEANLYYKNDRPKFDKIIINRFYKTAIYYADRHQAFIDTARYDSLQIKIEFMRFAEMGSFEEHEIEELIFPPYVK